MKRETRTIDNLLGHSQSVIIGSSLGCRKNITVHRF
jgi:hypothetical protein